MKQKLFDVGEIVDINGLDGIILKIVGSGGDKRYMVRSIFPKGLKYSKYEEKSLKKKN